MDSLVISDLDDPLIEEVVRAYPVLGKCHVSDAIEFFNDKNQNLQEALFDSVMRTLLISHMEHKKKCEKKYKKVSDIVDKMNVEDHIRTLFENYDTLKDLSLYDYAVYELLGALIKKINEHTNIKLVEELVEARSFLESDIKKDIKKVEYNSDLSSGFCIICQENADKCYRCSACSNIICCEECKSSFEAFSNECSSC